MFRGIKTGAVAIAFALVSSVASAGVLNFGELPGGWIGGNALALSNATVTTSGADIYVSAPNTVFGPDGGFCGVTALNGGNCATVSTITFNSAVSDLMFDTAIYNAGDVLDAMIYNGGTLLHSIVVSADTTVDFTGYSGITSIVLDASASTGAGYQLGNFAFADAQVPLPASGLLLVGGMLAFAAKRRRAA